MADNILFSVLINIPIKSSIKSIDIRAVARALIGGGGGIFIYLGRARLVSFEIKLIWK